MDKILSKLYDKAVSRRNFLVGAGAVGATTALAGCGGTPVGITTQIAPLGDADILAFALNLEYLEAEFYLYAATGAGLSAADTAPGSASTYGTAATIVPATTKLTGLTAAQQAIVNEIAYDEQSHVKFLRSALGTAAPGKPAIDLTFFGPLATVAGITTTNTFTPFSSFDNFLVGSFIFEDVGVTAYNGAAPLISQTTTGATYLAAAAGILAVEAYHAAYVRTIITANAIAAATATPATTYASFTAAVAVQKLRVSLGGGSGETLLTAPTSATTGSTVVNSNSSALAYSRTPDQVHHIVYGSATIGASKGGFFPNGTNYRFSTTTT